MKKMIAKQSILKKELHIGRYSNGQLAVFLHDYSGEPIAEFSIMNNSVELAQNEFILKDYSENEELSKEFLESNIIIPTDRFVLIGSRICSICQIVF
jgi:hypothetical protein